MRWPADPEHREKLGLRYRLLRWFTRQVTATWFREFSIIGHDLIPRKGGVLHIAWHAGAMVDPLVMFSGIPGRLTFVAKHTLFQVPGLSLLLNAAGAQAAYRVEDSKQLGDGTATANDALIQKMAELLAEGKHCAIYPEGKAHLAPKPVTIKTGPARILLQAIRNARELGNPDPCMIPIGLHYTDQHRFRERALMEIHRAIAVPPLPGEDCAPTVSEDLLAEFGEEVAADRAWVQAVTDIIESELNRTSIGMDSWGDRHMLWRTRSLVHQARRAKEGKGPVRQPYAEAIVAARRVRAAYQWLEHEEPEKADEMRTLVRQHHLSMKEYGLAEFEMFQRRKRPSPIHLASWIGRLVLYDRKLRAISGSRHHYATNYHVRQNRSRLLQGAVIDCTAAVMVAGYLNASRLVSFHNSTCGEYSRCWNISSVCFTIGALSALVGSWIVDDGDLACGGKTAYAAVR